MSEKTLSIYLGDRDSDLIEWINNNPSFKPSNFFRDQLRKHISNDGPYSPQLFLNIILCISLSLVLITGAWCVSFLNDYLRVFMMLIGVTVGVAAILVYQKEKRMVKTDA